MSDFFLLKINTFSFKNRWKNLKTTVNKDIKSKKKEDYSSNLLLSTDTIEIVSRESTI